MAINKIAKIPLETTAYYQALTKLNVSFWTQDKGTSTLQFIITRNNFPIALTGEDVKVILALESEGSFISTDKLDLDNEVEGVATYTIPSTFLAVAKNVTGQIYVAVGDDETVVQRKFSFKVENDLLSEIPNEEKIRYIKMFDDLKVDMEARLGTLDTALSQLEANVDAVNNARDNGVAAINNLYNAKLTTFNQNFDDKMLDISNATTELNDYVDNSLADMTQKKSEFDDAVIGSGLITEGSTSDWQKYKLTNEDGKRIYLNKGSFTNVADLQPGYYETVSNDTPTQGFPSVFANAAYIEIDVTQSDQDRKQITVTQSSRGQTFVKFIHTDGLDNGWKEIAYINESDPFETINGSSNKANTAENNAKQYTDDKISAQRATLFSGSVSNVNSNINLTQSMDDFKIIIVAGYYTGGSFSEVIVVSNIGTGHPIQRVNLSNITGGSPNVFEMELSKENSTRLKIIRDNQYSILGESATLNANNYTIKTIEGIK